jgi:hypothetical protein
VYSLYVLVTLMLRWNSYSQTSGKNDTLLVDELCMYIIRRETLLKTWNHMVDDAASCREAPASYRDDEQEELEGNKKTLLCEKWMTEPRIAGRRR